MKNLKIIKPGLLLIVPRTNKPLFAFFFLSVLFFQEKGVWVWESELKEDLEELEGKKKKHHLHIRAGGFHESRGCLWALGLPLNQRILFNIIIICGRQGSGCRTPFLTSQQVSQDRPVCSTAVTWACLCCDTSKSQSPPSPEDRGTSRYNLSTSHMHNHKALFVWGSLEWDGSIQPRCAVLLRVIKHSSLELPSNTSYDIWNEPCWG